jgi:molybdate transport system substrate-binding protein
MPSTMTDSQAIRILSAGAPKTGVRASAEAFAAETGEPFEIEFATAPVIKERVASGAADADLVVAPVAAMEAFAQAGHVEARSLSPVGAVRIGVVVRNGAREPDLSSVDTLVQAMLDADALVYNRASSGEYVARMIDELGIADKVAAKTVRVPTGAAVMEYLAAHPESEAVGFGQITEIRLHDDLGTHLVGPLPEGVGKTTTYAAAPLASARRPDAARALAQFMASPQGKKAFVASGVV